MIKYILIVQWQLKKTYLCLRLCGFHGGIKANCSLSLLKMFPNAHLDSLL